MLRTFCYFFTTKKFLGFTNQINKAGVNYYTNLIRELKDNGIEPVISLYHWDLPQPLQDAGGWENKKIIDWFADYARACFDLFGYEVKYWLTFNEPKQTCWAGYGGIGFAPGINSPGIGEYICIHNLLKAHSEAWHIYDREYRAEQKGI